ncbi:MAG: branched-chain amino acid ABC transporter permease [Hydrogenophaga sp.]|uniref:branched-chain amino acid ABC transporter permease n=1 Tax=Hydrogenophaga sp. TaxID=1904254 RepID=UPI00271C8FD4|nr:branched-chain amino acid ABC transporter permease [Hydrogenophaga sp.]MDO9572197.1 branched-chain amino acid ABC transporter permease [Hydrogenophaga sp.]MDP3374632.1 branched-chain amino acid ABC transporter permease [Hydrogenophaga sp.]
MIEALIQGLLLGGFYAILAAGLSLMFGVMRIINLAHGDLAIVGAFGVLALTERFGLSPWLALALVLPVMALVGIGLQRWLFARTLRAGILLPLLVTFGLGAVLQNALYGVFGSEARSLGNALGDLAWASWELPGGIIVGQLPVIIFVIAVAVLAGLQLMLSYTRLGRAIRAAASDPEAAALCGVDATRVHRAAAAIAVALAGLAGALLAMQATVEPYGGPMLLIQAFEAVVIGGIGSLWGTLLGGVLLGVAQSLGALWSPQGFQLAGHLLFLAVLGARLWRQHRHQLGSPALPRWRHASARKAVRA